MANILIVSTKRQDDPVLERIMIDEGHTLFFAEGGDEALAFLGLHPGTDAVLVEGDVRCLGGEVGFVAYLRASDFYGDIPVLSRAPSLRDTALALRRVLEEDRLRPGLWKSRRALFRLKRANFTFRTLEEAWDISLLAGACFPDPEAAAFGLGELMMNAVEHGNLGLTYAEKGQLMSGGGWQAEIARRLELPANRDKTAVLELEATETEIRVVIRDEGQGFDWKAYLDLSSTRMTDPNGRGIALARLRAFPDLVFNAAGNEVTCRASRAAEQSEQQALAG
jgi:Histidine kinase-like ATPase domain